MRLPSVWSSFIRMKSDVLDMPRDLSAPVGAIEPDDKAPTCKGLLANLLLVILQQEELEAGYEVSKAQGHSGEDSSNEQKRLLCFISNRVVQVEGLDYGQGRCGSRPASSRICGNEVGRTEDDGHEASARLQTVLPGTSRDRSPRAYQGRVPPAYSWCRLTRIAMAKQIRLLKYSTRNTLCSSPSASSDFFFS